MQKYIFHIVITKQSVYRLLYSLQLTYYKPRQSFLSVHCFYESVSLVSDIVNDNCHLCVVLFQVFMVDESLALLLVLLLIISLLPHSFFVQCLK